MKQMIWELGLKSWKMLKKVNQWNNWKLEELKEPPQI